MKNLKLTLYLRVESLYPNIENKANILTPLFKIVLSVGKTVTAVKNPEKNEQIYLTKNLSAFIQ